MVRSRLLAAVSAIGLALCVAGPADAQRRIGDPGPGPVPGPTPDPRPDPSPAPGGGGVTAQQLVQILQQVGYQNPQIAQSNGEVQIVAAQLNGSPVKVMLGGCKADGCAILFYYTFFGRQNVDANFINAFNGQIPFGKLFLDKQGELTLSMQTYVIGGVSPGWVGSGAAIYGSVLKALFEFKPQ